VNEEKALWYKVRDFCRSIGGDLLSIHTRQELEYTATIVSFAKKKHAFNYKEMSSFELL